MEILRIDPDSFLIGDLQPAATVLKKGGVIAYPTETVYGLGASIFQREAVARIFAIKGRDGKRPISIMISSPADVDRFCADISILGRMLMAAYWPGPLTLILKASKKLPDYIVSQEGRIGLRLPDHPICAALMRLHREPITSTSANLSGQPPRVNAQQIIDQFGDQVDLVIDGGECRSSQSSTVVDVSRAAPNVLREGAIPIAEIMNRISNLKP